MGTFIVISDFYNRKNPKCRNCKFYQTEGRNWASGKCVSETTKVKNRNRWDNDKACASFVYENEDRFII